ncbi:hypothetical protein [Sphingomonas sp. PB4P5]|uniref:hypothetical protein n=1 Tax=Parasphingomonas puruogangriensis TaxID=3096155 RepID=UPI002FC807B8
MQNILAVIALLIMNGSVNTLPSAGMPRTSLLSISDRHGSNAQRATATLEAPPSHALSARARAFGYAPALLYVLGASIALGGAVVLPSGSDPRRRRRGMALAAAGFITQIAAVIWFGVLALL